MDILFYIAVGFAMRHFMPDLMSSRANDFRKPMAEYLDTDEIFNNRSSFAREQAD